MTNEERAAEIARCDAETEARLELELRQQTLNRLPDRFRDRTGAEMLQAIRDPEHRAIALRWQWGDGGSILSGPSRVGKTTAAACLFRRLLAGQDWRWRRLRWVGSLRMVKARQEANRGLRDDVDPTVLLERASLLVLDDLGQEPATDWSHEILQEILEVRYGRGLPTIATTNLGGAELAARYGAPLLARIVESGGKVGRILEAA